MRVLAQWLDWAKLDWCHVPNEQRHRRTGVKSGVPDVLIFTRPPMVPQARGVAIELKRRKGGKTSPEQFVWQQRLTDDGWLVSVCLGADEAIGWLQSIGFRLGAESTGGA